MPGLSWCWRGHCPERCHRDQVLLIAPTASCMINVNCPFCMDDFFPAAELAPVAFDVAGNPMSCHGQTSDQLASAERRQNQVAAGSGFASLLKH